MWIRTQNRDELYNIVGVSAMRIVSEQRNVVYGIVKSIEEQVILGEYPTMDAALAEIDAIEQALAKQADSVYRMN